MATMTQEELSGSEIESNRAKEFQERLLKSRLASAKTIEKFNKQLEWDEKYGWSYILLVIVLGSIIGVGFAI